MRTGAMDPTTYASEVQRLEGELQDIETKLSDTKETAEEMLKTVLDFSELIKMANLYYKHANSQERHSILTQVFTELKLSNNNFIYHPKDGFLKLFLMHEQKKTHHAMHDVISGSRDWDRTSDLLVNSEPLCR